MHLGSRSHSQTLARSTMTIRSTMLGYSFKRTNEGMLSIKFPGLCLLYSSFAFGSTPRMSGSLLFPSDAPNFVVLESLQPRFHAPIGAQVNFDEYPLPPNWAWASKRW